MEIKHSLSIFSSRFGIVYKYLLIIAIICFLALVIITGGVYPELKGFIKEVDSINVFNHFVNGLKESLSTQENSQTVDQLMVSDYHKIKELVSKHKKAISNSIAWFVVLGGMLYYFIMTLNFTASHIYNAYMQYAAKFRFSVTYFAVLKKSSVYALIKLVVSVLYWAAALAITVGLSIVGFKIHWSLFFFVFVFSIIFFTALHKSLFALLLPVINLTESIKEGIKEAVKLTFKNFRAILGINSIATMLKMSFYIIFGLSTFGLGFIIGFAMLTIFGIILNLVKYHRIKENKYYVDDVKIIDSKRIISEL